MPVDFYKNPKDFLASPFITENNKVTQATTQDIMDAGIGSVYNPNNYVKDSEGNIYKKDGSLSVDYDITKKTPLGNVNSKATEQLVEQLKNSEAAKSIKAKVIANTMAGFKVTLDKIKNKFCKNRAIYTMYFRMDLGNNNTTLVNTLSSDWDENCLVSFKHQQNGSGEANQFTLELLYKPNDRAYSSIKTLEAKILSNVGMVDPDSGNTNITYQNCSFQYGYGDDTSLRSPVYSGMITGYKCRIENGNLRYTIEGVSGLTPMTEARMSAKDEYLPANSPLEYIQNIVKKELEEKGLYTLEILDNITDSDMVTIDEDYKQFNQKNVFQVIGDILSQCITAEQKAKLTGTPTGDTIGPTQIEEVLPTQKQLYGYYVSDIPTEKDGKTYKGTLYIFKYPNDEGEDVKDAKPDLGITFNWFGPGNDGDSNYTGIVRDWVPEYDGSVLCALACNLVSHDNSTTYYSMDPEGNIVEIHGLGAAREGTLTDNSGIASTIQEYSNWAFSTQYPYKASMTLIGCPCEVPMIGKICVNALMGDEKHHSSGIYYVLGKTDIMNNSGYWSTLELFKIVPHYAAENLIVKSTKDDNPKAENSEDKQQEEEMYKSYENYERDATENDFKNEHEKDMKDKLYVGNDGGYYYKDSGTQYFPNTTISAPYDSNK